MKVDEGSQRALHTCRLMFIKVDKLDEKLLGKWINWMKVDESPQRALHT